MPRRRSVRSHRSQHSCFVASASTCCPTSEPGKRAGCIAGEAMQAHQFPSSRDRRSSPRCQRRARIPLWEVHHPETGRRRRHPDVQCGQQSCQQLVSCSHRPIRCDPSAIYTTRSATSIAYGRVEFVHVRGHALLVRLLRPGLTVLDMGANRGDFSRQLSEAYPGSYHASKQTRFSLANSVHRPMRRFATAPSPTNPDRSRCGLP